MSSLLWIVLSVYLGSVLSNFYQAWTAVKRLDDKRGKALLRLLPAALLWPLVTGVIISLGILLSTFYALLCILRATVTILSARDAITRELFNKLLKGIKT